MSLEDATSGSASLPTNSPKPDGRFVREAIQNETDLGRSLAIQKPVYVTKVDGEEHLVYKSSLMEEGKLYEVVWNSKQYALLKTGSGVEIMKFHPGDKTGN